MPWESFFAAARHEWRAQVEPSRIAERLALLSLKGLVTKAELAHGLETLDASVTYAIATRKKTRATAAH